MAVSRAASRDMEDSYRLELSMENFKDSRRHQQPENAFYLTLSDARRINANTRVKKSALCTWVSHSPSSPIMPTAGRRGRHITCSLHSSCFCVFSQGAAI